MPAEYDPVAARMLFPLSATAQVELDTTTADAYFSLRATIVRSFSVRFATLSSATTIRKVPLVETPLTVALLRRANTLRGEQVFISRYDRFIHYEEVA